MIHSGPENIDLENPRGDRFECLRFAAEVLGQLAEHCRQVGIGCAIENKLPHLLFASIRDLLWILASMGQVPIGVCLDTGHGQLAGDPLVYRRRSYLWDRAVSLMQDNALDALFLGENFCGFYRLAFILLMCR